MNRRDVDKLNEYMARGFALVPWAHHPPEVKAELRRIGMRPLLKCCYRNSQWFAIRTRLDVEYREGWITTCGVPLQHAWLVYNGRRLDLTIPDGADRVEYHGSVVVDREGIAFNMSMSGEHRAVVPFDRMMQLEPMNKTTKQGVRP